MRIAVCSPQVPFARGGGDVDVLPSGAGKGRAIRHLITSRPEETRLALTPETRVVVCGDSGNDIDMFELTEAGAVPGYRIDGVAPSNALPELVHYLKAAPVSAFRASARCAAGVLEGLAHYGLV